MSVGGLGLHNLLLFSRILHVRIRMNSSRNYSESYKNLPLPYLNAKLKLAILDHIDKFLHLAHMSNQLIKGTVRIDLDGLNTPITLTFGDTFMSEVAAQLGTISTYDQLLNEEHSAHSQSTSTTSMNELPLDLSMKASALQSQKETPVKTDSDPVHEFPSSKSLFDRISALLQPFPCTLPLPTASTSIPVESPSTAPTPKRRRVEGTSHRRAPKGREYRCNQCDYICDNLSNLNRHTQETHGGYRCHLCKTSFSHRPNLERHALAHVGFKPYECILCGTANSRWDHLKSHVQRMHPSTPVEEAIRVKLRASQSLHYLQQMKERSDPTNTANLVEKTNSEPCEMGNINASGSGELKTTGITTNVTESPSTTSTDFISVESTAPIVYECTDPGSNH
ncbi:unnamed protein product [Rodentolepis nana]|uniref:C2H2-type domain-containing protein n=1 Tax=Rodentolepis nana TaxID=102285 RepID=A0A0R3TG62_RODNA|nr:unnamed protein product [Rodentolepis nana]